MTSDAPLKQGAARDKEAVSTSYTLGAELGTREVQRQLGAYYTPPHIAESLAKWAIRGSDDAILDPSCGDGELLLASTLELARRGASDDQVRLLVEGIELSPETTELVRRRLGVSRGLPRITQSNFFDVEGEATFDVVIGNPPYLGFAVFNGDQRRDALDIAKKGGVELSALSSSWAPFVIHATNFLKLGGRLAFVLPTELLSVSYASEVRSFLMRSFASLSVVMFSERLFGATQTDVILLLADQFGGSTDSITLFESDGHTLFDPSQKSRIWSPSSSSSKWSEGRMSLAGLEGFHAAAQLPGVGAFEDWGRPSLGIVTGANGFFAMSVAETEERGLGPSDLVRLAMPPRGAARGLQFTEGDWLAELRPKVRKWLFLPASDPSRRALQYIEEGERLKIHLGFKCSKRDPWWKLQVGEPGNLIVSYMSAGCIRVIGNPDGLVHLNSLHKFVLSPGLEELGMKALPLLSLCTLTLLASELQGRAYGGGVLKVELSELRALPIVSPDLARTLMPSLEVVRSDVDALLREGRVDDATLLVDGVVLKVGLGMSEGAMTNLQVSYQNFRDARLSRGASGTKLT